MRQFDLHPKPATSVRQRTLSGGVITLCTVLVALGLGISLASIDLFEQREEIAIEASIQPDDTHLVQFDVSFFHVTHCVPVRVSVVDALGRNVLESGSEIDTAVFTPTGDTMGECRLTGRLKVPAGKGTFRILPQFARANNRAVTFGNTHAINSLSVGGSSTSLYALHVAEDATHAATPGFWTYFLNLVPTAASSSTASTSSSYQVAATRTFHEHAINPFAPMNDGLVGSIYFVYEVSALRMVVDSSPTVVSALHFCARLTGVSGGLFTLVAAGREIAHKAWVRRRHDKGGGGPCGGLLSRDGGGGGLLGA